MSEFHRISINDGKDYLDWRNGSGGTIEIFDVAVTSERRKGRGRSMVSHLLRHLPPTTKVFAITRADNAIAQEWYEAMKFHVSGVLRGFYEQGKGVDAIVYVREAGGAV